MASRAFTLLATAFLGILAALGPALAISLEEARAKGLVGETARGYIAPVQSPTPEVTQLVKQVNSGRRAEYQRIAQATGSSLEAVEVSAAQKLAGQVPRGTHLQGAGGQWTRK